MRLGIRHRDERSQEVFSEIPNVQEDLSEEEAGALDRLREPQTSCKSSLNEMGGEACIWKGRPKSDCRSPWTPSCEELGLYLEGREGH